MIYLLAIYVLFWAVCAYAEWAENPDSWVARAVRRLFHRSDALAADIAALEAECGIGEA